MVFYGKENSPEIVSIMYNFYPRSPPRGAWVNRWIFSPSPSSSSPSSSHFQIFVSLRYRKCQFSNWFDFPGNSSDSYLFLLLLLERFCPENCPFLSGELSTDFRQSSDSYFSSVQSSPGVDIKLAHK